MKKRLRDIGELLVKPFQEWQKDNAAQLAAAIAYYTIFSLAPIIIIALAIAGQFFNSNAVRDQLIAQITSFLGPATAAFIGTILENSAHSSSSFMASIISFVVLLIGASGVFNQLQFALDKIWDVPPATQHGLRSTIKNRVLSFLMVLGIGFLLLVFLIVNAMISALITSVNGGAQSASLEQAINFFVLFVLMTVLFAMIFRIVPAKDITWSDVWLGAILTSLLFILGRYAISLYLTFSKSSSVYGAAGSLIVLLIWIYYSVQIFLLGAEFTQVYARKFGSHQLGAENAEKNEQVPQSDSSRLHQQAPNPE